jgi:hypothetical protein
VAYDSNDLTSFYLKRDVAESEKMRILNGRLRVEG